MKNSEIAEKMGTKVTFELNRKQAILLEESLTFDINPLTPRRTYVSPLTEISILFQERIIKKKNKFSERRDYESVDEKSLS